MDLIIFDCDGVLVNTEELAIEKEISFVQECIGKEIDSNFYISEFSGLSEEDWIDKIYSIADDEHKKYVSLDTIKEFMRGLEGYIRENMMPIPGAIALLEKISKKKCVVSNSSEERLFSIIEGNNLSGYFKGNIYSSSNVKKGKPAADIYLYACKEMGCPPSKSLAIEDTVSGVISARKAGLYVIGLASGKYSNHSYKQVLVSNGANTVIESYNECYTNPKIYKMIFG